MKTDAGVFFKTLLNHNGFISTLCALRNLTMPSKPGFPSSPVPVVAKGFGKRPSPHLKKWFLIIGKKTGLW
jgi:hypothetical protein